MTVKELAKKANVSVATISRALNQETRNKLATETLEKVDRLVAKFSYAPNMAAKYLRQSKTNTIGVILPHHPGVFFSDYYIKLIAGVSDALLDSDYKFKMLMLKIEERKWDKYGFKYAEGIDGLIVTHWPKFFSDKSFFKRIDIPCVIINDYEPDIESHFVCCDNEVGGDLVAKYLYEKGHRKFIVFTGHKWSSDSKLRLKGFKDYLRRKGIEIDKKMIVSANFQYQLAYEKIQEFINESFDALFCLNDGMAYGAINGLKKMGLKCPGDVSVVGFDNEKEAACFSPRLTTIDQPVYSMAKEAVQIILNLASNGIQATKGYLHKTYPVKLMERNSVKEK